MSEGGRFPWKVQRVRRVPTASYRREDMQLGEPPAGWEWIHNQRTRKWRLQPTRDSLPVALPTTSDDAATTDTVSSNEVVVVVDTTQQEQQLADAQQLHDGYAEAAPATVAEVGPLLSGIPIAHAEPITTAPPSKECWRRHFVNLEVDTFQGICLRYKISAIELRQANGFSGSNLRLAPSVLRIPHSAKSSKATEAEVVAYKAHEEQAQIEEVFRACHGLSRTECRAYLGMNDWNTSLAISQAQEDLEFEKQASRGSRQWKR